MHEILRQKITDAVSAPLPTLTRREARIPSVPGKALAVIGVRRSGKTSFLWQCLGDRLAAGRPREALPLLGLEDDRLSGMGVGELDWLLEEYFRQFPGLRDSGRVALFLDEIQNVPGWEGFVRRVVDTEQVEVFLSGSSAKLLSREVATSMRGRAMEVLIHPFSFREALRHAGALPDAPWRGLPKAARSVLDHSLRRYLTEGGFPEAQGVEERDRVALLRSYVDVVVLRDVIERHDVSNPLALRWMQRRLLANPAGMFSVQKFYDALRSQGIPVGKDTLHAYLAHLEDTFLIRTVSLHTASERRRMVNPRKAYPVDPGLIAPYERTGRGNLGHALETTVLLELERRGYETAYVRTPQGWEVDFLATAPGQEPWLVQVCLESGAADTWEREVRALVAAAEEHPGAQPLLLTMDPTPPRTDPPHPVKWLPATEWLLTEDVLRVVERR